MNVHSLTDSLNTNTDSKTAAKCLKISIKRAKINLGRFHEISQEFSFALFVDAFFLVYLASNFG